MASRVVAAAARAVRAAGLSSQLGTARRVPQELAIAPAECPICHQIVTARPYPPESLHALELDLRTGTVEPCCPALGVAPASNLFNLNLEERKDPVCQWCGTTGIHECTEVTVDLRSAARQPTS